MKIKLVHNLTKINELIENSYKLQKIMDINRNFYVNIHKMSQDKVTET